MLSLNWLDLTRIYPHTKGKGAAGVESRAKRHRVMGARIHTLFPERPHALRLSSQGAEEVRSPAKFHSEAFDCTLNTISKFTVKE